MSAPLALLFPGQGAQHVGMGRDLAEQFDAARETFREADEVLGFPLSSLCWNGPEMELTQTHNTQPAILVHSVATWRVVRDVLPDIHVAAGHSLGEFSANVAAGTLTFADAVRAVRLRGRLMLEAGDERPGTMAAVLGLDDDMVDAICRDSSEPGSVVVAANYNAPGQVVVSGDIEAVRRAGDALRDAGAKRVLPLSVSGAFHSPLMSPAEDGLRAHLAGLDLRDPAFAVVSNVTASPVTESEEARHLLVRQLTSPVRWVASMRTITASGPARFVELGPGNVLAGLLKRIDRGAETHSLGTAESVHAFLSRETA